MKLSDFGISLLLDDTAELNPPLRPTSALESAKTPALPVSWGQSSAPRPLLEREVALTLEAGSAGGIGSPAIPPLTLGTRPVTQSLGARRGRGGIRSPQQLTQAGSIIGTPQYMAPELARGSHHAQPAADVFSLGVLAYELLTGELPFAQWPIFSQLGDQQPAIVPLRSRCPELAKELAELFGRCLAGSPVQRPTAQELAERLAALAPLPHSVSAQFSVRATAS